MLQQRFDAGYIAAARDMPNGNRRVYVRVAKADHPYEYFNQDGTKRIERIKTDDLLSPASVVTGQGMPIFLGHPAFKLDSSNNSGHIHGAVGDQFVREDTSNGTFLGVVSTLYTDDAKAQSDRSPGVSPGYAVQIARQDSGEFLQTSRIYDHLAVAVTPRGGADVRALFEGIRLDAIADSDLWIARYDEECYFCDSNEEFIDRAMNYGGDRAELIQNSPIRLTEADLAPPIRHDDDVGGSCGCSECAAKVAKKGTRGKGFAAKDKDEPPTKKKKRMSTTSFQLDGVTWEDIPSSFAQAVQVRVDRIDAIANKNESMQAKLAALEAENDTLREIVSEMEADAEGRTDSEDEGDRADSISEEDFLTAVIAAADTVDRMRSDGRALVADGKIKEFNQDAAYICENMGELQRDMIAYASPAMGDRLDSFDDAQIAAIYDATMTEVRSRLERQDSEPTRRDVSSLAMFGRGLRHDSAKSSSHWKDRKKAEYDEELDAHNAAYNSVGKK